MNAVVALIDAGGANLGSVRYALERLGATVRIAGDADALEGCDRIILPGVGAAAPAMRKLLDRGFVQALRESNLPLLGICLGMQLLYEDSEEGAVGCLGLLEGRVRRLQPTPTTRVPHMGWNQLEEVRPDPLLDGIQDESHAYFVHGFVAPVGAECVAACKHGERFAAVVRRGRVLGTQFHPERSGGTGAHLLGNFLRERAA